MLKAAGMHVQLDVYIFDMLWTTSVNLSGKHFSDCSTLCLIWEVSTEVELSFLFKIEFY